jgi:hypothetical protein
MTNAEWGAASVIVEVTITNTNAATNALAVLNGDGVSETILADA